MSRLPSRATVAKTGFAISLTLLGFFYGFASNTFELFPNAILERAWEQYKLHSPLTQKMRSLTARVYDRKGVRVRHAEQIQPGLTLVATVWKDFDWRPGAKLLDAKGRTIHEWMLEPARLFPTWSGQRNLDLKHRYIHGTYLFPNGDLLANVEYVGTVRVNACGDVIWKLANGHHSIARADDQTFWIPATYLKPRRLSSGQAGERLDLKGPVYEEFLLRVGQDGEILDSLSVLDILYANDLDRYIWKSGSTGPDVAHLNDIEPLSGSMAGEYPLFEAGDIMVSLRNLDLVFVADPESKRVKWHSTVSFIEQHDADFMGAGWIGVFDNNVDGTSRGSKLGGSRIIAIEPHTDSTMVLFPTQHSESFYTRTMGKWQQLDNGNLLLTESKAGRILEVTADGRTVWEWVTPPYDESTVPEVSEGTRYNITPDQAAKWPCSPE